VETDCPCPVVELTDGQFVEMLRLAKQHVRKAGWRRGEERMYLTPPCGCHGDDLLRCSCHGLSIEVQHDGEMRISWELCRGLFDRHIPVRGHPTQHWSDGALWADRRDYDEAIRQLAEAELAARRSSLPLF
jgi:hypothetical protein